MITFVLRFKNLIFVMQEENVAIRLKVFMDSIGLSSSQFADTCGISRPTLSQLLSGRNKKVSDIIVGLIHKAFPQLSIIWLLFGEGDMMLSSSSSGALSAGNAATPDNIEGSATGGAADGAYNQLCGSDSFVDAEFIRNPNDGTSATLDAGSGRNRVSGQFSESDIPFSTAVPKGDSKYGKENGLENGDFGGQRFYNKSVNANVNVASLISEIENLRKNPRRVSQITIYYDDSTFETFYPGKA